MLKNPFINEKARLAQDSLNIISKNYYGQLNAEE